MSYKTHLTKSFVALAVFTLLASCTSVSASNSTPASSTPEESSTQPASSVADLDPHKIKCEVKFWHTIGKANLDTLNTMITEFNKIYPDIKVTTTSQGGYDQLKDAISNNIAAHTVPTMAYCYPDHVAEYLAAGASLKMDDYINSTKWGLGVDNGLSDGAKTDFIQNYWNEGNQYTISGKAVEGVYSLPFSKSTEILFYNKTAFTDNGWTVPTTWDQMWTLCQDIRDANPEKNADGTYKVIPFGYDSDANWYITLSEQKKIKYTSGTGDHFLFNNDSAKAMVTDLKTKYDSGYFKTQATLGNNTYTSTKFTNKEIMMSIGSSGGTTYNYTENFTTGVAAIPQADADNGKVIMQGPSICFFKDATPEERLGAWLFYKFITNTKNSAIWSVSTGYNPVRTSSFSDPVYTDRADTTGSKGLVKTVAEFLANSANNYSNWYYTSPAFKGSSTARVEMGGVMGSVMLGTKSVDKAFSDAMANCLFAA